MQESQITTIIKKNIKKDISPKSIPPDQNINFLKNKIADAMFSVRNGIHVTKTRE